MLRKKRTAAESQVNSDSDDDFNSQLDPHSPQRPKRNGAGRGGAAKQLERCADAITRPVLKRPRTTIPSDEPVNKLAPPQKKGTRRHKQKHVRTVSSDDFIPSLYLKLLSRVRSTERSKRPRSLLSSLRSTEAVHRHVLGLRDLRARRAVRARMSVISPSHRFQLSTS